jgi:hypothetical protein
VPENLSSSLLKNLAIFELVTILDLEFLEQLERLLMEIDNQQNIPVSSDHKKTHCGKQRTCSGIET